MKLIRKFFEGFFSAFIAIYFGELIWACWRHRKEWRRAVEAAMKDYDG